MDNEEMLDLFWDIWKGTIRTFYSDRVEWSEINEEIDMDLREKMSLAPKTLGFVTLSPAISLTAAGQELVQTKRKEEIFLRQLLKFQLPSPFHKPTEKAAKFWVKPYLEIFRLIRHFGSLNFDEVMLFGLQLVDYKMFDAVVAKIDKFRIGKAKTELSYKAFRYNQLQTELQHIYKDEITRGKTKTRESNNATIDKFLQTKASNMRDYTDALFRYLRATGMVNISHIGKSISIAPEKILEVDYFLKNTNREPCFVDEEKLYTDYLADPEIPQLLTDNKSLLLNKLHSDFPDIKADMSFSLSKLKDILFDEINKRKETIINEQITAIKDYRLYDEITITFSQIADKTLYDIPLMLEWNVWRAMTMLDGGQVKTNLKFDDFGNPMSTAQGNMADIVCDYGGVSTIIPLPLSIFQKMVDDSYKATYVPEPQQVKRLFERSNEIAKNSGNEEEWYQAITSEALNWLR